NLAFFKAFAKSGASNCTQRTDDFVSGSRTQTWMFAELLAAEIVTATRASTATTPTAADRRKIRFTAASYEMTFWGFNTNPPVFGCEPTRRGPRCPPAGTPEGQRILSRSGRDRHRHARLRVHGQGALERISHPPVPGLAAAAGAAARRDRRAERGGRRRGGASLRLRTGGEP